MSFVDYDNLCATIGDWLARDDLTAQIKDFVWLAECDIQRKVRFRDPQDKIFQGSTVDGQEWLSLPGDYAEGGLLRWTSDDNQPILEVGSIDVVDTLQRDRNRGFTGTRLRAGFLWGDRLYIGPSPGDLTFDLFYKSGVQHMGQDISTNLILQEYPDCLLYGALGTSAPFLGADERLATWGPLYERALEETQMAEWRARTGHGTLRMRPDVKVF